MDTERKENQRKIVIGAGKIIKVQSYLGVLSFGNKKYKKKQSRWIWEWGISVQWMKEQPLMMNYKCCYMLM